MKKHFSWALVLLLLLTTCGEEKFSAIRNQGSETVRSRINYTNPRCSKFTLIKPAVDFLFLWDNSSSQFSESEENKTALNNMVTKVSNQFDFRILMAPILDDGQSHPYVTNGTVNSVTNTRRVANALAADSLGSFGTPKDSTEAGVKRAIELINHYQGTFFRNDAYMIVVLMSNEDDDSWQAGKSTYAGYTESREKQTYINARVNELIQLKSSFSTNYLRFVSLTKGNASVYREVSRRIHIAGSFHTAQSSPSADNYNIENGDFKSAFNSINNSIEKTLIKHKYDYWPVAGPGSPTIAVDEISVIKTLSDGTTQSIPSSSTDGFTYVGDQTNQNTRYEPTPGEPFTGKMIQLHGNARVSHPECLTVKTVTPKEYFGYIPLNARPVKSSIKLAIDGKIINESKSNGWELLVDSCGEPVYYKNKNIQITSSNDDTPQNPGLTKSGYMLKVHGTAVYTNSSVIKFSHLPRGKKSDKCPEAN